MTDERRKWIQILLAIFLVAAAVRLYVIYHGRRAGEEMEQQRREREQAAARDFNANYYVVPKKLYAYDLKSAQQLTKQPVWVKEGYRQTFYPYRGGHADYQHEAGLLGPLEKLQIQKVVTDRGPSPSHPRQVLAVFEKGGKTYAVPIGQVQATDYRIYADDMFFIEDPHELYKWPPDMWHAIESHEAKQGMDEIQATFALGMGVPKPSDDPQTKTVVYPNGGNQVVITYRNGRAADIQKQGKS